MMKNKVSETKIFIKKNIASDISNMKLDLVVKIMVSGITGR